MWAYGSPEIWPDGFHENGRDANGQVQYAPNNRNFAERLFNENSITFFILFIIFVVCYIFESVIISVISKTFFRSYNLVDENQPPYSEIKTNIADWTLHSYDPVLNLKYNKILSAMVDVAEVNREEVHLSQVDSDRSVEKSVNPDNTSKSLKHPSQKKSSVKKKSNAVSPTNGIQTNGGHNTDNELNRLHNDDEE